MSVKLRGGWRAIALVAAYSAPCFAGPANRPFQVGGGEGGGGASGGIVGWLINTQSQLTHQMSGYLRALPHSPAAFWSLILIGFLYGVFHAAGPGHGKAVIASYVTANDQALRRGLILSLFAALLQGLSAIVIVGVAAVIFATTAARMNEIADALATASYCGIMVIGAWLTWKKGHALVQAARRYFESRLWLSAGALFAGAPWQAAPGEMRFASLRAVSPDLMKPSDCGHVHMLDPGQLGAGFTWRSAATTVFFAGARPCSGALLILVYALAQHLFWAGIAAVFAMSVGTAVTTGAIAALSVFAKSLALRAAGRESPRANLVARGFEFSAAVLVFLFGATLLFATSLAA